MFPWPLGLGPLKILTITIGFLAPLVLGIKIILWKTIGTMQVPCSGPNQSCEQRWMGRLHTSGCGAVGLPVHLLPACHDGEKTSSKHHVNRMMFVWLPVSSGWRYGYVTVLLHGYTQDDSFYILEKSSGDRKFCVEVVRTWWVTVNEKITITPTRYDIGKSFQQLLIFKAWGWYWANVKTVVLNL